MNVTDLMIDQEIPVGSINGTNKIFTLEFPPDPASSLQLFLNGILQTIGEDYTLVDVTITFVNAPPAGSIFLVDYRYSLILISTSKIGDVDGSALNNDEGWTDDATADGKVVTFIQATAPTAEGVGDLWIDSDDGNKLYRWSGSAWTEIQDTDIAQAIIDAANAQTTADSKTDDTAANAAQGDIDSHSSDSVLDHPDNSVMLDHLKDFSIERHSLSLESVDGWDASSGLSLSVGTIELDTGTTINTWRYADASTWEGVSFDEEMLAQWRLRLISASDVEAYIYVGGANDSAKQGFGFKFVNGSLYAFWLAGSLENSTEYTQIITGITTTSYHIYRVEYDPGVSIKFYVDGVLKHTATTNLPNTSWGTGAFCGITIENTVASSKKLLLSGVYFTAE